MEHLLQIQKFKLNDAEIAAPVCLKIIRNEKGNAVYLNSTESVKTVALLEFAPGGAARGNHYHHIKHESIYILSGRLTLFYWLPEGSEIKQVTVEAGDLVTITPQLAHAYKALEHSIAFEVGIGEYDLSDTVVDMRVP
jgi:quercetin dioxygenase-like cupin family protein